MMNAKEHNNLLGIFLIVYEALQVIGLLIGIVVMVGMMGFVFSQVPGREAVPFGLVALIVVAALLFSALLLVPGLIAAIKIRRESPDARGWAIAASIIALLNFPLGTALGVYGLTAVTCVVAETRVSRPIARCFCSASSIITALPRKPLAPVTSVTLSAMR